MAVFFFFVTELVASTFVLTGDMATNRSSHVSVLLGDGRVLVAGGEQAGGVGNQTSEVFDPLTGLWATNGNLSSVRRFGAAAVRMTNGSVLISGGTDSLPLKSVEIFNPISGLWTNAAVMASVRSRHTATLLQDGRLLVVGGQSRSPDLSVLAKAQLYQTAANTWVNTGTMNTGRYYHSAIRLNDGRVLVMGGLNSSGTTLSDSEIFNPFTETWATTGAMNTPRYRFPAILLTNDMVLVHGGFADSGGVTNLASAELYDPNTGVWTSTGSMTNQRAIFASSLLANGQVLATGGLNSSNTTELYDPDSGTWMPTSAMISNRAFHSATLLADGKVLVVGGAGIKSAEIYDPVGTPWPPVFLMGAQFVSGGGFQFSFTNTPGSTNTILKSTNVAIPINNWMILTTATEAMPGHFQFTDFQATNASRGFYRVSTP